MQTRAIIITTVLALAGCTNNDIKDPPPLTTTAGTGGSDGGADSESGGSDGADSESDGGDMCELPKQWECSALAFVAYFDKEGQTYVTGAVDDQPVQGPRPCLHAGDIATGAAVDVASVLECGAMAGAPPPDGDCLAACNELSASDLGYAAEIVVYGDTRKASVQCFEHDEIPDTVGGLEWGGISSQVTGSCAFPSEPAAEVTATDCDGNCDPDGVVCDAYDGHNTTITSTSGNTSYVEIDYYWVQDMFDNVGLAFCDPGRYSFYDQTFGLITTDSVMYDIGIRNGDTDLQVWKHNATTYNRIGSIYHVDDLDDALDAFDALIPGPGNNLHITAAVTRSGVTKTFHIDIEY